MSTGATVLIIADTNVAYILYFFLDKGILPKSNITLRSGCVLKFHPIVQLEVTAHIEAWQVCKQLNLDKSSFPPFFNDVGQDAIEKLDDFVSQNIASIPRVDTNSSNFFSKRKTYESERLRLQAEWRSAGTIGRKVTSHPSNNDYSILFSAETRGHLIATNDEILMAVAQEFLEEGRTLKAEDIVNDFLKNDPSIRATIEEVSEVLSYLGFTFNLARACK